MKILSVFLCRPFATGIKFEKTLDTDNITLAKAVTLFLFGIECLCIIIDLRSVLFAWWNEFVTIRLLLYKTVKRRIAIE